MKRLLKRALLGGVLLYAGIANAQFNGCAPGFCASSVFIVTGSALLLEDASSYVLLEDNSSHLCLESGC